jgi:hypothetical protein
MPKSCCGNQAAGPHFWHCCGCAPPGHCRLPGRRRGAGPPPLLAPRTLNRRGRPSPAHQVRQRRFTGRGHHPGSGGLFLCLAAGSGRPGRSHESVRVRPTGPGLPCQVNVLKFQMSFLASIFALGEPTWPGRPCCSRCYPSSRRGCLPLAMPGCRRGRYWGTRAPRVRIDQVEFRCQALRGGQPLITARSVRYPFPAGVAHGLQPGQQLAPEPGVVEAAEDLRGVRRQCRDDGVGLQ